MLCTGDELLSGLTADTNSSFFAERVFELGQKLERIQIVGDRRESIVAALRELSRRADVALVSGGLGPTLDDLTAECAAEAAGVPLLEDPQVLAGLRARFEKRGLRFTPNNARQARFPAGSVVIPNPVGTAPMFVQTLGACTCFYVPGVPREFKALVESEVLPRIRERLSQEVGRVFRVARLLKTVGLPESHLDALMASLVPVHPDVEWAFRTQAPENHVKLTARGPTQEAARKALAPAEEAASSLLGPFLFGKDSDSLAGVVVRELGQRGETVAVAESCTGGLLSGELTSVPGASHCFVGAKVPYVERLKVAWAAVGRTLLEEKGAVSGEVASALAAGVRTDAPADWGVGITGFAGPSGGTPEDPVGTVYCAVSRARGTFVRRFRFGDDRERVRRFAVAMGLDMLRRLLLGLDPP